MPDHQPLNTPAQGPCTSEPVNSAAAAYQFPWLLLVGLLLATLPQFGGCKREEPAAATPRQAATSFFKAMVAGDLAAAKAASVGDERSERWLEAVVDNTSAMRAYHDAMKARFGADAAGAAGLSDSTAGAKEGEVLDAVEKGEEKVDGESATITSASDRRKLVHLKRVNGVWKVDRGQLGGTESVDRFVERTRRTAKAYRDLAAEVRDPNKYKSATEARQAFGDRLIKAIEEMPPGGT